MLSLRFDNLCVVTYALAYTVNEEIHYLWQPIPKYINELFWLIIKESSYHRPFLSKAEKQTLLKEIHSKLKKPVRLRHVHCAHKTSFHAYFTHCIEVHPTLSTHAKGLMLNAQKTHHQSAQYYQYENSDRLRYRIYTAYNEFFERLFKQATHAGYAADFYRQINNTRLNLAHLEPRQANYLKGKSIIAQYRLSTQSRSRDIHQEEAVLITNKRAVDEVEVIHLFKCMHRDLIALKPQKRASQIEHLTYYQHMTYILTLQFIALTGARPTHAITIDRNRCYAGQYAAIKDKGRLRILFINDFLRQQIQYYLAYQSELMRQFGISQQLRPASLCFLIDQDYLPAELTAKDLRIFLQHYWPAHVPYQLRHNFAQFALVNILGDPLPTHLLDLLMGHSRFGEHIGSLDIFPASKNQLMQHLNLLTDRLLLERFV